MKTFPTTQHRRRGKSQRLERKITLYHKPLPPVQGVSGLQYLLAILCFFAKKRLNRMYLYRASQKKCTNRTKSQPKMSAVGLNFTINMTWEGLIRLSLGKKRPKKLISRHKGCRLLVIEPVHYGSNSIMKVRF